MSVEVLSVELKESINSYDARDRVMTDILRMEGVNTVYIRFPEAPTGKPLFRMLDVELDGTVNPLEISRTIDRIDGVAETKTNHYHRYNRGPLPSPSP